MSMDKMAVFIIFCTVVISGVFTSQVAVLWLKNKREERIHEKEEREKDREDRFRAERKAWAELAKDQAERINRMNEELVKITRNYEQAKQLMDKVNLKGETL